MGRSFFPLDEELQLLPGNLTPRLQEILVRLGSWMPFDAARQLLLDFLGLSSLSEATVRRHTERAGAVQVRLQEAAVERLEQGEELATVAAPGKLAVEVDGAMVPLVGGEWAEVKTLVIGKVAEAKGGQGAELEQTSSFSRLSDAQSFTRWALVETQRRGVEPGGEVALLGDGAEWIQGFGDFHCPDAVRILDFPHAAGYVAEIGQGVFGEGDPQGRSWLEEQLHCLKHQGGGAVLAELRPWVEGQETDLSKPLSYLEKRESQMQYPVYQAQGWPIGSGAVESANKLVVEARLKGGGMHWAREQVNPMLALRNIVCSDRWAETWPQIAEGIRQQAARQRREGRQRGQRPWPTEPVRIPAPEAPILQESFARNPRRPDKDGESAMSPPQVKGPRRPSPDHPWRRAPVGRIRPQVTPSPKS